MQKNSMINKLPKKQLDFFVWGYPIKKIDILRPYVFLFSNATRPVGLAMNIAKKGYKVGLIVEDDCEILNIEKLPKTLFLVPRSKALKVAELSKNIIICAINFDGFLALYPEMIKYKHKSTWCSCCFNIHDIEVIPKLPNGIRSITFNNLFQKKSWDELNLNVPSFVIPYGVNETSEIDNNISESNEINAIWIGSIRQPMQLQKIINFAKANPECIVNIIAEFIYDQSYFNDIRPGITMNMASAEFIYNRTLPVSEKGHWDKPYVHHNSGKVPVDDFNNIVKEWCKEQTPKNVRYLGACREDDAKIMGNATMAICFSRSSEQKHDDTKIMHYLRSGIPVLCDKGQPSYRFVKETGHGVVLPFEMSSTDFRKGFLECLAKSKLDRKKSVAKYIKYKYSWLPIAHKLICIMQPFNIINRLSYLNLNILDNIELLKLKLKSVILKDFILRARKILALRNF